MVETEKKGNLIDNIDALSTAFDNNETASSTSSTGLSSTPGTGAEDRNRPTNRGEIQAAPISKGNDRVLISFLKTNKREKGEENVIICGHLDISGDGDKDKRCPALLFSVKMLQTQMICLFRQALFYCIFAV